MIHDYSAYYINTILFVNCSKASLNAWYIEDDVCIARGKDVYATAICCKFETDSPTVSPTLNPTFPTLSPTPPPTLKGVVLNGEPTYFPTFEPTMPTIKIAAEVTNLPTASPTLIIENPLVTESEAAAQNRMLWDIIWTLIALVLLLSIAIVIILVYVLKGKKRRTNQMTLLTSSSTIGNSIEMTQTRRETNDDLDAGTEITETKKEIDDALPEYGKQGTLRDKALEPGYVVDNESDDDEAQRKKSQRLDSHDDLYDEPDEDDVKVTKGDHERSAFIIDKDTMANETIIDSESSEN